MNGSINSIFIIASNEFKRVIVDPLVIVVFTFLLILMFLNGIGVSSTTQFEGLNLGQDLFISSFGQVLYVLSQYCTAVVVFIGALSLAGERSRHSLSVLLTKPLYRRDIIIGKFIGLNAFILIFVALSLTACAIFLFVFADAPQSLGEFITRFVTLVLILFFECSLVTGLSILVGILFKNILHSALIAVTFFYIGWYSPLTDILGKLNILVNPFGLYFRIIDGSGDGFLQLLDTTVSYVSWVSAALSFLVLIILEILAILILDCMLFIRNEEV